MVGPFVEATAAELIELLGTGYTIGLLTDRSRA